MMKSTDTTEALQALYQILLVMYESDRRVLSMYTNGHLPAMYERAVEHCTLVEDRLTAVIQRLVEGKP